MTMRSEKLLALALSFDDAPQSVKDAAQDLQDAYLASEKADTQFQLWNQERQRSMRLIKQASRSFEVELKKWDPAGNTTATIQDAPVRTTRRPNPPSTGPLPDAPPPEDAAADVVNDGTTETPIDQQPDPETGV